METPRPSARPFLLIGLVWLVVALVAGGSGALRDLRPPAPQLLLATLTVALLVAMTTVASFRAWLFRLDVRYVLAFHLTRFVGIYFLVLHARGELPYAFAVPGGWGDIVVAVTAVILILALPHLETPAKWLTAWNVVGLLDIVGVVATAARLAFADPASMSALLKLPLSLLITFVVPIIIASHVLIFWRLRVARSAMQP